MSDEQPTMAPGLIQAFNPEEVEEPTDGRRRGNKFTHGDKIDVYIGEISELEGKISLYY